MGMHKAFRLGIIALAALFFESCEFDMCSFSGGTSCREPAGVSELPSLAPLQPPAESPTFRSKGIRLDPSYFYTSHTGQTPAAIASDVISTLKAARVNTIYLYAYNSVYGAYYPTSYAHTAVENGYGQQNIFAAVTAEANRQGLKVIAVVPLNNFKKVWQNNPSWRVKEAGGVDYLPISNTYLLSASVTDFKNWYTGFIDDLIARNPLIDAVEAVEPTLDYRWDGAPDQNPEALSRFAAAFPASAVGSANWKTFRAQEFTNLISLFNQRVHLNGKETYIVQTWTAESSGQLMNSTTYKNNTGFDFDAITTLTGLYKTDHIVVELIWQQWYSEYGNAAFNPEWVTTAGADLQQHLTDIGSRSELVIHFEISDFNGGYNSTTPTDNEFSRNISAAKTLNHSMSVYDYNQMRVRQAFDELSQW